MTVHPCATYGCINGGQYYWDSVNNRCRCNCTTGFAGIICNESKFTTLPYFHIDIKIRKLMGFHRREIFLCIPVTSTFRDLTLSVSRYKSKTDKSLNTIISFHYFYTLVFNRSSFVCIFFS